MAELKVVVHGALGKMGQEVLNAVNGSDGLVAVGAQILQHPKAP